MKIGYQIKMFKKMQPYMFVNVIELGENIH